MKKSLLLLAFFALICAADLQAQKDVYLKINHKMGDSAFAFNTNTVTSTGDPIKYRRFEYYMSNISLIHDGGQETKVPNTWLLIKANTPLNKLLGNYAITNLEEIRFAIGVQPELNHLDPSIYAPSHPLAPKSPSMHWGWEAGYRFIALEGSGGVDRNQNVEVHTLGDENYLQIKINTAGTTAGSDLTVELNADYNEALGGLETEAGLIAHSSNLEATDVTLNFVYRVFTSSEGNKAALSSPKIDPTSLKLFPNPSSGRSQLVFSDGNLPHLIRVFDQQGKCVNEYHTPEERMLLENQVAGFYMISMEYTNGASHTLKWVVTP